MRIFALLVLVPFLTISLAGCNPAKATDPSDQNGSGPTLDTLELDPAKPIVIAGWWSNGRYLLEVEYDFAYRIRQGDYPNSPIIERGRWARKNHGSFDLEPYNVGKVESERVALSLDKGVPVATIAGLAPFHKLSQKPKALKEQLYGTWRGRGDSLQLKSRGEYILKQTNEKDEVEGTWRLERGSLILQPHSESKDPQVLSLRTTERGEVNAILGFDAQLTRR